MKTPKGEHPLRLLEGLPLEVLEDLVSRNRAILGLKKPEKPSAATISQRMRYLIAVKGARHNETLGATDSRRGLARLLADLEAQTGISESRWRDFLRGKTSANETLISAAAKLYPQYAIWFITGSASRIPNIDPTQE